MPLLDTQLIDSSLVDAHVSISFDHLATLLTQIINQTNDHEKGINELRAMLRAEVERGDKLESLLKDKNNEYINVADMYDDLNRLKDLFDSLKKENEFIKEKAADSVNWGTLIDQLQEKINHQSELFENEIAKNKDLFEKKNNEILFLNDKLNNFVNLTEESLNKLREFENDVENKIKIAYNFVQSWSADPDKLEEICQRNKAGNYLHHTEVRTEYILSLPPFQSSKTQVSNFEDVSLASVETRLKALEDQLKNLDDIINTLMNNETNEKNSIDKVPSRKPSLAQRNSIRASLLQQKSDNNKAEFEENLLQRVSVLEQQSQELYDIKADKKSLNSKVEVKNFDLLREHVDELRNDVNNIITRLTNNTNNTDNMDIIEINKNIENFKNIENVENNFDDNNNDKADLEKENGAPIKDEQNDETVKLPNINDKFINEDGISVPSGNACFAPRKPSYSGVTNTLFERISLLEKETRRLELRKADKEELEKVVRSVSDAQRKLQIPNSAEPGFLPSNEKNKYHDGSKTNDYNLGVGSPSGLSSGGGSGIGSLDTSAGFNNNNNNNIDNNSINYVRLIQKDNIIHDNRDGRKSFDSTNQKYESSDKPIGKVIPNEINGINGNNRIRYQTPRHVFLGRSVAIVRDNYGMATPASISSPNGF